MTALRTTTTFLCAAFALAACATPAPPSGQGGDRPNIAMVGKDADHDTVDSVAGGPKPGDERGGNPERFVLVLSDLGAIRAAAFLEYIPVFHGYHSSGKINDERGGLRYWFKTTSGSVKALRDIVRVICKMPGRQMGVDVDGKDFYVFEYAIYDPIGGQALCED